MDAVVERTNKRPDGDEKFDSHVVAIHPSTDVVQPTVPLRSRLSFPNAIRSTESHWSSRRIRSCITLMMLLWAWRIMNHVRYKSINRNTHRPLVTMFARTPVCLAPFRYSLHQMITCRCRFPSGERQGRMLNHLRAPAGTVFICLLFTLIFHLDH